MKVTRSTTLFSATDFFGLKVDTKMTVYQKKRSTKSLQRTFFRIIWHLQMTMTEITDTVLMQTTWGAFWISGHRRAEVVPKVLPDEPDIPSCQGHPKGRSWASMHTYLNIQKNGLCHKTSLCKQAIPCSKRTLSKLANLCLFKTTSRTKKKLKQAFQTKQPPPTQTTFSPRLTKSNALLKPPSVAVHFSCPRGGSPLNATMFLTPNLSENKQQTASGISGS